MKSKMKSKLEIKRRVNKVKIEDVAKDMTHSVQMGDTVIHHNNERLGECQECGDDGVVFNEDGELFCEECLVMSDMSDMEDW